MLKERISYEALAVFSFAGWPYSIKLFVAPIVDSVYSRRVGRRKVCELSLLACALHYLGMSHVFGVTVTIAQQLTSLTSTVQ